MVRLPVIGMTMKPEVDRMEVMDVYGRFHSATKKVTYKATIEVLIEKPEDINAVVNMQGHGRHVMYVTLDGEADYPKLEVLPRGPDEYPIGRREPKPEVNHDIPETRPGQVQF